MTARRLRQAVVVCLSLVILVPEIAGAIQCRIRVVPINFGTYMPLTTVDVDVIGQIEVQCQAQPGTFVVAIGPGTSGDPASRTLLAGPGQFLAYNLYRDPAHSQIWGDGTPPTFVVTGARTSAGPPTRINLPVYARIFANQSPDPGQYVDNLTVTVLF